MFPRLFLIVFLTTLTLSSARAQSTGPTSSPNAAALASQALQAVAGTTTLSDITIQATANYTAGSDQESGTATLVALGNAASLVTLNLSDGQHREIREGIAGAWVGPDGTPHAMLSHNNFVDASWFYPAFTLAALTSDPTLGLSLVGQEVHAGQTVFHLVASRAVSRKDPNIVALIQRLSTMHLYLDAATLLPAAFAFNIHPDTDTGIDIAVEIRFAGYQSFSGVQVPTHIQKYLQNSLLVDLAVTNVTINSGVPASLFALPSIATGGAQ